MIGEACIRSSALPRGMSPSLGNVDQDDVAQFGRSAPMRGRGADVARSDDADLRTTHAFLRQRKIRKIDVVREYPVRSPEVKW